MILEKGAYIIGVWGCVGVMSIFDWGYIVILCHDIFCTKKMSLIFISIVYFMYRAYFWFLLFSVVYVFWDKMGCDCESVMYVCSFEAAGFCCCVASGWVWIIGDELLFVVGLFAFLSRGRF